MDFQGWGTMSWDMSSPDLLASHPRPMEFCLSSRHLLLRQQLPQSPQVAKTGPAKDILRHSRQLCDWGHLFLVFKMQ